MIENNWKTKIILFLTAQTISLFGSSLVQYAIIWYITLTTSSGMMLTISTVCGFLPQIAISLFAGVWIDRYDRKKMIMLSDGVIAIATLVLAVLFLTGYKSIWLLFYSTTHSFSWDRGTNASCECINPTNRSERLPYESKWGE